MRLLNKWYVNITEYYRNPHRNGTTYLIHSNTDTTEEVDCVLQNTDFLSFYITHSLIKILLENPQGKGILYLRCR